MRRAGYTRRPVYATLAQVQAGAHYAMHGAQPDPNGPRYPMVVIDGALLLQRRAATHPAEAHGKPEEFCYVDGVLELWPEPGEGWRVFSEVSGKDVTP